MEWPKNIANSMQKIVPSGQKVLIFSLILVGFFGIFSVAFAQGVLVADTVFWFAEIIIELVGKLLIVLIEILLAVVTYNDFINAAAVQRGWVLVRDLANMAFLLIFVAIAFATILGIEKYEYKKLLPKLLLMAIAINFSKTIAGIVLDAAQVIMITFVKGFEQVAAGNLIRSFGLNDILALQETAEVTASATAATAILGVALLVIATVTVGIIVIMFVARIVYLWILIVLAPAAFLMAATPGMAGKFDDWWNKFIKYAFLGPIMAFFLWLSFTIMAAVPANQNLATANNFFESDTASNVSAGISVVSSSDLLLSYGISIALLLASLSVAQGMGVAGGAMAGDFVGKVRSGGVKLAKLGGLAAMGTAGLAGYAGFSASKITFFSLSSSCPCQSTHCASCYFAHDFS